MQLKKIVYYISRFAFLDELLGLVFWALALYGMFLIAEHSINSVLLIVFFVVYIPAVVIIYLTLLKKIKAYFKDSKP